VGWGVMIAYRRKLSLVIPAKAGIQLKMQCAAHDINVLSASHVLELDSSFRWNDEQESFRQSETFSSQ
jgi:hypothetical protein